MSNFLYVYGTLRPGGQNVFHVPGQLFDLGRFPGIKLWFPGGIVICEKIEVKDWDAVDRYEGYDPDDHAGSLYIRRPYLDGFIYEFNRDVDSYHQIDDGDWLAYKQQERGSHGRSFGQGAV